jgi:hypothetical protein
MEERMFEHAEGIYTLVAGAVGVIAWFIRLESSVKANDLAIKNVKEDVVNTKKDMILALNELKKDIDKMVTNQDAINKEHFNKLSAIEITLARVDGKLDLAMSMQENSKNSRSGS